jgi:hypothetical protein
MPGATGDSAAREIPLWIIRGVKDIGKIALMASRRNGLSYLAKAEKAKPSSS